MMPGQMRVTFKNFTNLDFSTAQKVTPPGRKANFPGEETVIKGGLKGLAAVSNRGPLINGLLDAVNPPLATLTVAGSVPGAVIRSPAPDFTLTLGLTGSAGAGVAAGLGAGVYFWTKRPTGELGLYGSISLGVVGNMGASAGDQFGILFGPAPSVLAGDSITVSVDVGVDIFTFSGLMFMTAPPVTLWPPALTGGWTPEIIGVGFALTAGVSVLPVDVSVMPGRTWIKPVTP